MTFKLIKNCEVNLCEKEGNGIKVKRQLARGCLPSVSRCSSGLLRCAVDLGSKAKQQAHVLVMQIQAQAVQLLKSFFTA